MNYILPLLIASTSYFFLPYFAFIISGRNRKIPYIIFVFLASLSIYQQIILMLPILSGIPLIREVVLTLLPIFLGWLLLRYAMGESILVRGKFKSTKLKDFKEKKDTAHYQMTYAYLTIFLSIVVFVAAVFTQKSFLLYALSVLSIVLLMFGIYRLILLLRVKDEFIILVVGKDKEKIYIHRIDDKLKRIDIKTFYTNDNYIIDPIAYIELHEKRDITRHYVYWIATSQTLTMDDDNWIEANDLCYASDLKTFEKYQYYYARYQKTDQGFETIKLKKLK